MIGLADGSGRSYHIETEQGDYRRNRKDIHALPDTTESQANQSINSPTATPVNTTATPVKATPTTPATARIKRITKAPAKFKDFVRY